MNKISVTGKAMGPIESALEDWDLKVFDERTNPYDSSHISPTNRIPKLDEKYGKKVGDKTLWVNSGILISEIDMVTLK